MLEILTGEKMETRKSLKQTLMDRDEITADEADELIRECRDEMYRRLDMGEMPDDILEEYFGLEPDWLDELI